jgi:hypothetical protein
MQQQPRAERQDFDVALGGLEYPVSRAGVINHARDHGGVDAEAIAVVEQLPDREYASADDLREALLAVYAAHELPPSAAPL